MQSRRKFVYPILCSVFIFAFLSVTWGGEISKGKFYVVGTGPAGPEHLTLKALEIIKMADFIICSKNTSGPF